MRAYAGSCPPPKLFFPKKTGRGRGQGQGAHELKRLDDRACECDYRCFFNSSSRLARGLIANILPSRPIRKVRGMEDTP